MLKRQESVMTSQNRRESQSIGCMAGLFNILSKYHSCRRFLTTSKKQETKQKNNSSCKRKCRTNVKHRDNTIHKTTEPDTERRPSLEKVISPSAIAPEVEAEVKRTKLVVTLEKCDEDLNAINTIVYALRSTDQKLSSSCCKPSEVIKGHVTRYGGILVQQTKPQPRKDFFEKVTSQVLSAHTVELPQWMSKAKIECVDEVFTDLVWGIERELGKIGLILEDYMFRYLIHEFVNELKSDSAYNSLPKQYHAVLRPCIAEQPFVLPPLPLEACKRELSF